MTIQRSFIPTNDLLSRREGLSFNIISVSFKSIWSFMSNHNYVLLKNGNPAALVNIHARYYRRIFWVGKQLIGDEFVIETLVQDAFLKLWEKRDLIQRP